MKLFFLFVIIGDSHNIISYHIISYRRP